MIQKAVKKFVVSNGIGILWFLCVIVPSAFALQVTSSVDKNQGTIEDYFMLTLTVKDARQTNRPHLPSSPHFKINFQGQSSQTQWINGKKSSQIQFKYSLEPLKTGNLTIPSVVVIADDTEFQTRPLQIRVTNAKAAPKKEKLLFVQSSLKPETAYPNQTVIYNFELFIRRGLKVSNLRFERPELSDFQVDDRGKTDPIIRMIGGVAFEVYSVKLAITPLKLGDFIIPAASLYGNQIVRQGGSTFGELPIQQGQQPSLFDNFEPFFGGRSKRFLLRTSPLKFKVVPFPKSNRPKGFYGLSGQYAIRAELSQSEIKVGDSVNLTITITGTGQAEKIQNPVLDLNDSLKIYEDQPIYLSKTEGTQYIGQATFTSAIVPSKPGIYSLPPFKISFFDTELETYQIRESTLPPLKVIPGENQQLATVGGRIKTTQKQKVQQLGEDLLPIHKEAASLQNQALTSQATVFYELLFLMGPLLFSVGWCWKWQKERSLTNHGKRRNQNAFSNFKKEIKRIQADITDPLSFTQTMMFALKNYVGDKVDTHGEALTSKEIEILLKEKQIPQILSDELTKLMEQFEYTQYAASTFSEDSKEQLYKASQTLVANLEKQLK